MARRRSPSGSIRKLITGLAAVSLLLFVLPTRWTSGLLGLVQIIVPLQDASTAAVESVGGAVADQPTVIKPEDFEEAQRQAASYAHQAAALAARVDDLEREVEALTATRHWDAGGSRIGSKGRLVPARVVVGDVLAWRSSQLITTGSLQGIPQSAPVLSNSFTLGQGEQAGLNTGMAILLGEAFVGWVEKVGPHVSRVKLLSDPSIQMKVRIGRFGPGGFSLVDGYFWIVGRGGSSMEIRDVEARTVQAAAVEVGDVVLSDSTNEMLPAALTIGTITAIMPDRDNPLFVHLAVKPVLDLARLDRVFVYDPQPEPTP
jgi:cell shape-determining protein MreC